jgi:hypothetical protein
MKDKEPAAQVKCSNCEVSLPHGSGFFFFSVVEN